MNSYNFTNFDTMNKLIDWSKKNIVKLHYNSFVIFFVFKRNSWNQNLILLFSIAEELDQDFESMLQSIEDQVECEVEQVLEGQPETEIQEDINNVDDDITDTKEHLNFDFGPAAKRKKPLEDATNNINPAKKAKKQVKKHPDGKPFQCWQWYVKKR